MQDSYTKDDAVEQLRTLQSSGRVTIDRAKELAFPWGVEDAIQEWSDDLKGNEDFPNLWESMPVPMLVSYIVSQGIGDKPISGDEYYFGNSGSIGGHGKADRGKFKGNLAIIERDAGMEMTYGIKSPTQNRTEPCENCGRTCIYAQQDGDLLECANCGTTRAP